MTRRNDTRDETSTGARAISPDFEIRTRVLQEMQRCPNLDISDVYVEVGNGIVTLQGEVPSIMELSSLAHAIRAIPAVHELRSHLRVKCHAR